ncbi:Gfo/Idh/MocA family oxidoreductase [Aquabacterium sp.]|jgi:myo-inositol 2-dehydrogenase/D-chiro-inositol 1-dehydrogenase|uniref:Gfo/Idh/MocA family oxidoreductase n=1 Tax=Aquabacterium sp. TaxID=1872578 RepID=UPI0025BD3D66|nr:Gfo/Idh/MocA family oxidoreductase [Aquabacterium sp.]
MSSKKKLQIALIGAGRIGSSHAEIIDRRLHNAELVAVADPAPGAAARLADHLECDRIITDPAEVWADPGIDAVVIASPARFHTPLAESAARAGKHVFCEKPMALSIAEAERVIQAVKDSGVHLQVGFNRRWDRAFAAGRDAVDKGQIGEVQLMRSLTRDPGPWGGDPAKVPQWTIFYETLIHDFDTLLWLNPGARPVEVFAQADALVRPDARASGHLDTAVVTIRFDNGALAVAEANFNALYGYDIRGEVFGNKGMVTMGDVQKSNLKLFGAQGISADTWRLDTQEFADAYTAQFQHFTDACLGIRPFSAPTGRDARAALAVALAAIESVKHNAPVAVERIAAL